METTMKLLKTRVQSRLALHKQFASLGKLVLGLWLESHSDNTGTEMTWPFTRLFSNQRGLDSWLLLSRGTGRATGDCCRPIQAEI